MAGFRSVFYAQKKKPAGRSGGGSSRAVTRLQNALHIAKANTALANHEKSSYKIAHHVMQESTTAHRIDKFFTTPMPCGGIDDAHIVDLHVLFPAFGINRRK